MATNIREEIDKHIVDSLKQTEGIIRTVTRQFIGLDLEAGSLSGISKHQMPAVIVNSGNESFDAAGPAGRVNMIYTPELVGFVHDQNEYFTELNQFIAEVKKLIFSNANVMHNNECIALIQQINLIRIDRGRLAPLAVFAMELNVRYNYQVLTGGELDF